MNCSGCNKILASTLSVCPSCGTMRYDSVREELAMKISPVTRAEKFAGEPFELDLSGEISMPVKMQTLPTRENSVLPSPVERKISVPSPKDSEKTDTTQISAKQTSPTLVEFRNKNATVPEWRLQMQNAVRKRIDRENITTDAVAVQPSATAPRRILHTQGATALKPEIKEEEQPKSVGNPKLANALRRIEQSRQSFYVEEKTPIQTMQTPTASAPVAKNYPFTIVSQTAENATVAPEISVGQFESKTFPIPVAETPKKFDTNKLPPLSEIINRQEIKESRQNFPKPAEKPNENHIAETEAEIRDEIEDTDDYAPLSLRFNAGLFDLIIGSFASFILLAPFMIVNGNLFSIEGFFAFLVTNAIVMFIYLTTGIALFGRTLGMSLFSLEIIDIEENDYPTLHQAAVNSVVYLFSLAVGGIGFLPILLNEERRAAHDLAAGTIVIKEY